MNCKNNQPHLWTFTEQRANDRGGMLIKLHICMVCNEKRAYEVIKV